LDRVVELLVRVLGGGDELVTASDRGRLHVLEIRQEFFVTLDNIAQQLTHRVLEFLGLLGIGLRYVGSGIGDLGHTTAVLVHPLRRGLTDLRGLLRLIPLAARRLLTTGRRTVRCAVRGPLLGLTVIRVRATSTENQRQYGHGARPDRAAWPQPRALG